MKYPLRIQISSGLGTGLILSLGILVSYGLYTQGMENKIFANNYSTTVLLSDSLTSKTGAAAPWALFSLMYFVCRSSVKKWRRFIFRNFA